MRGVFWGNLLSRAMVERLGDIALLMEEYRSLDSGINSELMTLHPNGFLRVFLSRRLSDFVHPYVGMMPHTLERGALLFRRFAAAQLLPCTPGIDVCKRGQQEPEPPARPLLQKTDRRRCMEMDGVNALARERLISVIKQQGLNYRRDEPIWSPTGPLPVVTLEEFFEGNHSNASIGVNLCPDHPGVGTFWRVLSQIRSRPDVQDVLIEVYEVLEDESDSWPFSERVYVFTSADPEQVAEWLEPLRPDLLEEGFAYGRPPRAPEPGPGMKVYSAWWD